MGVSNIHIATNARLQNELTRSIIAYVLLFLVSISFIVEHIPFMESDIMELVESTEKEKETKDDKLLLLSQNIIAVSKMENGNNYLCGTTNSPLKGISIDIITPPPELC